MIILYQKNEDVGFFLLTIRKMIVIFQRPVVKNLEYTVKVPR